MEETCITLPSLSLSMSASLVGGASQARCLLHAKEVCHYRPQRASLQQSEEKNATALLQLMTHRPLSLVAANGSRAILHQNSHSFYLCFAYLSKKKTPLKHSPTG